MNVFRQFDPRALTFNTYNAMALAHCADKAYKSNKDIAIFAEENGFDEIRFFDAQGTQAYIMGRDDAIVLAFRGTEPDKLEDVATDLRIRKIGGPLGGHVHRGFLMALLTVWDDYAIPGGTHRGVEHALKDVKAAIGKRNPDASPALWVTGHSLGAGLATLATAFLVEEGKPVHGLYTFGSPRVGDSVFASTLESRARRIYRLVNNNDIVTRVPPRSFGYDHVGEFWYLSEHHELRNDPDSWYLFLDRSLGHLCDIGEIGTDGIKDHSMNNGSDGYIPALFSALNG